MDSRKIKKMYYKHINAKAKRKYKKEKRHSSLFALLNNNKKYKDLHINQRCFILGNGPSLKKESLSMLRNEVVFTVNQATRIPGFNDLKSNYHFWADPNFFKIDDNSPEDVELLNTMIAVANENPNIQCFFPLKQFDFIRKYGLDSKLNINYFYTAFCMYEGYTEDIDFTKPVIGFGTVVQWCITMAVYMGFKEIYLLGCDNTSIITTIKSVLHTNDDQDYSYTVSQNEKKRMEKMLANSSLEAYLKSYLRTIQDYRFLYDYCTNRGISLVNCSAETVIDSIPRKRLSEVLSEKKYEIK